MPQYSPPRVGGNLPVYNITAATVVKASPGTLATVAVSASTSGTVTVYDSILTTGNTVANEIYSGTVTAGQVLVLNWPCATGIVVVPATATISVAYS